MTTPVLIEAPPGAPVTVANPSVPTLDPALAAEFAAMLVQAEGIEPPLALRPIGPAVPIEPILISEASLGVLAPIAREGETATARSAAPADLPDSARVELPLIEEATDQGAVVPAPVVIDVAALAATFAPSRLATVTIPAAPNGFKAGPRSRSEEDSGKVVGCTKGPAPIPEGCTKGLLGIPETIPNFGDELSTPVPPFVTGAVPEPSVEPVPETIPDAHTADVVAILGSVAHSGTSMDSDTERERSADEGDLTVETLAGDRPAEFEFAPMKSAGEVVEARPLDRSERTRIVHETIDRVSRHVETLALTRSKEPLTIRLEPADLGRIVVEVSREVGSLVAEMSASDPRVAETLDRHRSELAAGLAARGYAEARITVHATTPGENPGFDLRQGGQNPQGQPQSQPQRQAMPGHAPQSFATTAPVRTRARTQAAGLDLEI